MLCVLLVMLCGEDEEGGECIECRAALRVRPVAGVSTLPLTSWGGCFTGMLCLRKEGRDGGGDTSLLPVTLDDTRLFLSGLKAGGLHDIHISIEMIQMFVKQQLINSPTLMQCCLQETHLSSSASSLHDVSVYL